MIILVQKTLKEQSSPYILGVVGRRVMERSRDGTTSGRGHEHEPMEVKEKGIGPEEDRRDTPSLSVGKEMAVRQAVKLTVGVNQHQNRHYTGISEARNEGAERTRGTEREISLREAKKMLLTTNEDALQKHRAIMRANRKEVHIGGSRACGEPRRWGPQDGRTEVRELPSLY